MSKLQKAKNKLVQQEKLLRHYNSKWDHWEEQLGFADTPRRTKVCEKNIWSAKNNVKKTESKITSLENDIRRYENS